MVNHFMLQEAIHSVSLEHTRDCDCITCKAANGDKEALAEFYKEL